MANDRRDVPEWLREYVQEARALTGVSGAEWDFGIRMDDRPGGSSQHAGAVVVNTTYLSANIEFARDLEEGDDAREAAWHEVWHVGLAELCDLAREATEHIPNDPLRDQFAQRLRDAEERYIQRTVRNLLVARLHEMPEEAATEEAPHE